MSESNKQGTPVALRGSMYSQPSMGTNNSSKGGKTETHPDKNIKRNEKPKANHPIAGDAPSEPSTSAPVVHPQARHSNPDATPQAGTRTNANNPEKEYIPRFGGSTEVRGYQYPEDPRGHQTAKNDESVVRRCIDKQIESSTPTAEMVENDPVKFPKNKQT
jgi:hypothetical protein